MKLNIELLLLNFICFNVISRGNCHERFEDFQIFETHRAPKTFKKLQSPPSEKHTLTLNIALRNQALDDSIDELLNRMSDPEKPTYRPHFTDEEAEEHSKPPRETVEAVLEWLEVLGFLKDDFELSKNQDWVTLKKVPIKKAEEMLQTKYSVYKHHEGDHIIRTESYSLPRHLHRHIELVQPTTMFGRLNTQKTIVRVIQELPTKLLKELVNPNVPNICNNPSYVTNDCLRQLYKTEGYEVKSSGKNAIGITGYLGEAANFNDAQKFLATQRVDQKNHTFSVVYVNGGKNPQQLDENQVNHQIGVEANLDTQTALGITSPTKNVFYTTGGQPPFTPDVTTPYNTNEPYLEWITYILSQPVSDVPKVISTSYGDNEQTVPESYAKRVCNGFAQLGMRGVSVIFSSGDYGVGKNGFCWSNDGSNSTAFMPIFPATCPYVTSVGATENFSPEVAVSESGPGGFLSGGGFSNYFETPEWQRYDVSNYLDYLGPETYPGMFNQNGRGFPDVSAQGAKYVIAWQNEFLTVGGTSASAPTFASVIALLNDYSISLGGSSLGFLNPWLYRDGRRALNDITRGNAGGCDTEGFPAIRGWDPVTGLGTPNFKKLQSIVKPWSLSTAKKSRAQRQKGRSVHSKKRGPHIGNI